MRSSIIYLFLVMEQLTDFGFSFLGTFKSEKWIELQLIFPSCWAIFDEFSKFSITFTLKNCLRKKELPKLVFHPLVNGGSQNRKIEFGYYRPITTSSLFHELI